MSTIYIDDLANPKISEAGQKVLAARAAVPIDYNIDAVIKFAENQLDVPLFRDDYIFDSFDRFMREANETHDDMSQAGKGLLAASFADSIVQRSRMEALLLRHPEINDVEIKSPVLIAGLPRSGTTNLSNIMSADLRFNSMKFWEGWQPVPSLKQFSGEEEDNRDSFYEQGLEDWYKICPYFKNMIDVPYDGTQEECLLFHMDGLPVVNLNHVDTPKWREWFWNEMDAKRLYSFLKRALQVLQWSRGNSQRWILKSPHHLPFLPVIDEVFDDVRFVITHRDPASSMMSNATMMSYLYRECYDNPDPRAAMGDSIEMIDYMLQGLVRDIDKVDPARVHHVYFHSYMADNKATLKGIYESADLEWTPDAEAAMDKYVADHPRGRHGGRLVYKPEKDFGVTREEIRSRYPYYFEKFPQIRVEDKHG